VTFMVGGAWEYLAPNVTHRLQRPVGAVSGARKAAAHYIHSVQQVPTQLRREDSV
jgi:hypothetical protein